MGRAREILVGKVKSLDICFRRDPGTIRGTWCSGLPPHRGSFGGGLRLMTALPIFRGSCLFLTQVCHTRVLGGRGKRIKEKRKKNKGQKKDNLWILLFFLASFLFIFVPPPLLPLFSLLHCLFLPFFSFFIFEKRGKKNKGQKKRKSFVSCYSSFFSFLFCSFSSSSFFPLFCYFIISFSSFIFETEYLRDLTLLQSIFLKSVILLNNEWQNDKFSNFLVKQTPFWQTLAKLSTRFRSA